MSLRFEGQDSDSEQLLIALSASTKTFEAVAAAFMQKRLCLHRKFYFKSKQSWPFSYIALEIFEMYKFLLHVA
jgi:hypothetical protein